MIDIFLIKNQTTFLNVVLNKGKFAKIKKKYKTDGRGPRLANYSVVLTDSYSCHIINKYM